VSDNYVNGTGATNDSMYRECAEICLAGRILRVSPHDTHGYRYYADESYVTVPAAFCGYTETAKALAEYHRTYHS
jgi:hypothetical protein